MKPLLLLLLPISVLTGCASARHEGKSHPVRLAKDSSFKHFAGVYENQSTPPGRLLSGMLQLDLESSHKEVERVELRPQADPRHLQVYVTDRSGKSRRVHWIKGHYHFSDGRLDYGEDIHRNRRLFGGGSKVTAHKTGSLSTAGDLVFDISARTVGNHWGLPYLKFNRTRHVFKRIR